MANVLLVSPTTHKFSVKAGKHGNEHELMLEFQANVALSVPAEVAEARIATYPKQYRIVKQDEADKLEELESERLAKEFNLSVFEEQKVEEFDVKAWFLANNDVDEKKLKGLADINKLWAIAKALRIKNIAPNSGEDKLVSRIMADIESKKTKKVAKENVE